MAINVFMPDSPQSIAMRNALAGAGLSYTVAKQLHDDFQQYVTPTDNIFFIGTFRDITETPPTPAELKNHNWYVFQFRDDTEKWIRLSSSGEVMLSNYWYEEQALTNKSYFVYTNIEWLISEDVWRVHGGWVIDYNNNVNNAIGSYGESLYIMRATIGVNYSEEHYDPTPPDERIFAKQVGVYKMNVGVRANSESERASGSYVYTTKTYNINLKWVSPVSGHSFTMPLNNLIYNTAFTTAPPLFPAYNFSTAGSTGNRARALRMPLGAYATAADIPDSFSDMSDVGAVSEISLADLKTYSATQYSGITNNDVFTEITAEFVDVATSQVIETKTLDYSSLFGEDIDITGSTFPSPNDEDSITDDNVYSDHIDLTVPTLTATGVFNRCYVMDANGVNDLCDYLYNASDSIFDEIIDGVLTRGNPIESLIDLRLYPFDVRQFTGAGTSTHILFGRTDTGIVGIKLPHNANAVISLGSCVVPRYYQNFVDYDMTAQLYIPFCGVCELPIDRVLNHTLSIKLIVDYITGACTAVVFVDSIPLLYQHGVIGVSIPMTATNSAEFSKTIIGNLITGAADIAGGNYAGAVNAAGDIAANLWNGSHIQKVGASSPQTALYQPKNAYILFSIANIPEGAFSDTYANEIGYACFMPVSNIGIMTGTGLAAFDNVDLQIGQATDAEKAEILNLLSSGVYM